MRTLPGSAWNVLLATSLGRCGVAMKGVLYPLNETGGTALPVSPYCRLSRPVPELNTVYLPCMVPPNGLAGCTLTFLLVCTPSWP